MCFVAGRITVKWPLRWTATTESHSSSLMLKGEVRRDRELHLADRRDADDRATPGRPPGAGGGAARSDRAGRRISRERSRGPRHREDPARSRQPGVALVAPGTAARDHRAARGGRRKPSLMSTTRSVRDRLRRIDALGITWP